MFFFLKTHIFSLTAILLACENWVIVLAIINLIPKCHLYNCLCNYENMYICLYLEVIVRTSRPSLNFSTFLDTITQYPYTQVLRLTHSRVTLRSLQPFFLSLSLYLSPSLSLSLSIPLSLSLFLCPSISLSLCFSLCLSLFLSLCLSLSFSPKV